MARSIQMLKNCPCISRRDGRYFDGFPLDVQVRAYQRLHDLILRHRDPLNRFGIAPHLLGVLVGNVRRDLRSPKTSEWGKRMFHKRGGKAVQMKYRALSRHPTKAATDALRSQARIRRERKERERDRTRLIEGFTTQP